MLAHTSHNVLNLSKSAASTAATYPEAELELVGGEHHDVVIKRQDRLRLDLFVGIEAVAKAIVRRLDDLQRLADPRPLGSCSHRTNAMVLFQACVFIQQLLINQHVPKY